VRGFKTGAPETYPRKTRKADRPRRFGVAYVLTRGDAVALVRRPPKGLLGGMLGLPTSDWRATPWTDAEAAVAAPAAGAWRDFGTVEHVFTHFALTLRVLRAREQRRGGGVGRDLARQIDPARRSSNPSVPTPGAPRPRRAKTPQAAASNGVTPRASRPAINPPSTSPEPETPRPTPPPA
jgi:adenine-specific DNA glycosylase